MLLFAKSRFWNDSSAMRILVMFCMQLGLRKSRKSRARLNLSARLNLARFWLRDLRDFVPIKNTKIFNFWEEISYFLNVKWVKVTSWMQMCNEIPQNQQFYCAKWSFRIFTKPVINPWFLKAYFFNSRASYFIRNWY